MFSAYPLGWFAPSLTTTGPTMSSCPRVAESLSDLAVGMVVAWEQSDGSIAGGKIASFGMETGCPYTEQNYGPSRPTDVFWVLADPPVPPAADWVVPADAIERLRSTISWMDNPGPSDWGERLTAEDVVAAARAVLDAATEQTTGLSGIWKCEHPHHDTSQCQPASHRGKGDGQTLQWMDQDEASRLMGYCVSSERWEAVRFVEHLIGKHAATEVCHE